MKPGWTELAVHLVELHVTELVADEHGEFPMWTQSADEPVATGGTPLLIEAVVDVEIR